MSGKYYSPENKKRGMEAYYENLNEVANYVPLRLAMRWQTEEICYSGYRVAIPGTNEEDDKKLRVLLFSVN